MGFGKRLRKRVSHVAHAVTKIGAAPIHTALKPVIGDKAASLLSDPGSAIIEKAHPLTTAIGKLDANVYGTIGGGLVGAAITRGSGNKSVFGGTGVDTIAPAAIQIEKPLLGVAGGLVAGGLGSSIAGAVGDAIAPTMPAPNPQDFLDPGMGGGGGGGALEDGSSGSGSGLLLVAVALVLLLALGNR
jgi:hypothetical protein